MKARMSIIIAAGAASLMALLVSEASAKDPGACESPTRVCQKWTTVGDQRRCAKYVTTCDDKEWLRRR